MKRVLKLIVNPLAGKSFTQSFFERLYKLGLYGMNVGGSSDLKVNGEMNALLQIKRKLNTENPVIFDVGANVGGYVTALLQTFEKAEIHAFEPLKRNFDQLTKKFKSIPEIHLIQKGIGDKKGKMTIHYHPELGSMASVYKRQLAHHHFEIDTAEEISIDTISGYCREKGIDEIDFLKLDIEGHELAALKGTQALLAEGKIRFIQFEFGGTNIDSKTYFQDFWYLLSSKYRIYRILKNGLREIKSYNENNEVFGYVNYLAELK